MGALTGAVARAAEPGDLNAQVSYLARFSLLRRFSRSALESLPAYQGLKG